MINIQDYTTKTTMSELCSQINMPEEVTNQIIINLSQCDFKPIESAYNDLFEISKGKEAFHIIKEFCNNDQLGIKELTIYLSAALHTRELYHSHNIDDTVFIHTMKMFTRFVNEYINSYGIYGFDRGFWTYRILALNLFRLGELEYEMYHSVNGYDGYITKGDPVLYVHIPSDALLTRDKINESYHIAKEFFNKYFYKFEYKYFFTDTWLLSPELKKLLPETSKILLFQSDYKIIAADVNDESFMQWVFKRKYDDYNELTENTSLERSIKKHLLSGGKIGSAAGIF